MTDSFSGLGVLVIGEERIEGVGYRIEVVQSGPYHQEMRGTLVGAETAPVRAAFTRAFNEATALLELRPDFIVNIIPTEMSAGAKAPSFSFVAVPIED